MDQKKTITLTISEDDLLKLFALVNHATIARCVSITSFEHPLYVELETAYNKIYHNEYRPLHDQLCKLIWRHDHNPNA